MTAQMPEILRWRGRELALCEEPLRDYLARLRRKNRPQFGFTSTACHRGYVGTWEFRDNCLWLVGLSGVISIDGREKVVDLAAAMPWAADGMRADWFDGTLRCPEGRLVSYVHHGWGSVYERERCFSIHQGRLMDENLILNPPVPVTYRIAPDGSRTCIYGLWHRDELPDPLGGDDFSQAHKIWGTPPVCDEDDEGEDYILGAAFVRSLEGGADQA